VRDPIGTDPADIRRPNGRGWHLIVDLLPLALLTVGAAVGPLRPATLAILVAGFVIARSSDRRRAPAWAATLPVAVTLVWGLAPLPAHATDGSTCEAIDAPFATVRLGEAVVALTVLAVLMRLVGGGGGELGLQRPSRRIGVASIIALVVLGPIGLVVGPWLAGPFFGPVRIEASTGAAIPALVFALSNGIMEEVIYRGALRAWTRRVTGPRIALVGQALVFGLAHTGPDFVGSPVPAVMAMFLGGLVAGWIVERTGSLAFPIAAHVGLDIPLYYGNACRIP
jgi:membrane protease YdiL (CAAX protease family)